ncbi:MAG: aspartate kinase [Pseudomonadota bacterium]
MSTPRVVMKFGGTSVADLERISRVADAVEAEVATGAGVAVVVSAMAGETNRLVALCEEVGRPAATLDAEGLEYDAVVSSGEQVSSGLLALALQRRGFRARSWQGWQIPLATDRAHGRARILDMDGERLGSAIDGGEIAVIAGFQGIADDGRIATLGRGGSDTSAVAAAAALKAERCDIYTDVDGVYTTDPRIEKSARRLAKISYEEMLELASMGAKVLQTRSVELAMAHSVRLRVLSSFIAPDGYNPGTVICDEDEIVEKQIVSGVAVSRNEARISLLGVPDEPGRAARMFQLLAEAGFNIDMIVQSPSRDEAAANMSFTLPEDDLDRANDLLSLNKDELGFYGVKAERNVAKVSVVGVGMKSHAGVASTMFTALAERGINIHNISTSEIKISVLIDSDYAELAVRALHDAYGLGSPAAA